MFHMMNEARIAVGLGATMLGYAGYEISLDYAKGRPQGRPTGVGGKDASQAAGADHRARRRQAHAARAEELLRGRARARALLRPLVDELHTGDDAAERARTCCSRC
jgi:butyryl-CoA dehydrogenase